MHPKHKYMYAILSGQYLTEIWGDYPSWFCVHWELVIHVTRTVLGFLKESGVLGGDDAFRYDFVYRISSHLPIALRLLCILITLYFTFLLANILFELGYHNLFYLFVNVRQSCGIWFDFYKALIKWDNFFLTCFSVPHSQWLIFCTIIYR